MSGDSNTVAVDIDFAKHCGIEFGPILRDKGFNLVFGPRFLSHKLIARKAKDSESFR